MEAEFPHTPESDTVGSIRRLADHRRKFDNRYNAINYQFGSSIRFWANNEPTNYNIHWHPAIEIIMPLENIYTVTVKQKKYILLPGDIFIIPSGELHCLDAPESGVRLIYMFDLGIVSQIRGFNYLSSYFSNPLLINREGFEDIYDREVQLMIKMCDVYFTEDNLREFTVYTYLLEFLTTYAKYQISMEDTEFSFHTNKQKELIKKLNKVFDYLNDHYAEDITLAQAAEIAGFSQFHFSRIFKQCSGHNFHNYLWDRRVKAAESLLLKPELPITEIALQSGFTSISTFNRLFRQFKNCTPSEYRKLYDSSIPCR